MHKPNEKDKVIEQGMAFRMKCRRLNPDIKVNMIPMLNLALLLIISYKVAVYYAPRPGRMEITLPSKYYVLNPEPIPEAKLLRLFVDEADSFYYQIESCMDQPVKADFGQMKTIISDFGRSMEDPVMLLKLDPRASYESMVRVTDKIQCMEKEINKEREDARLKNHGKHLEYYHARFILRDMSKGDESLLKAASRE